MIDAKKLLKLLLEDTKDLEIETGFKIWLKFVMINKRLGTVDYYQKILKRLYLDLKSFKVITFQAITNDTIFQLTSLYKERKLSNNTINKFLTAINTVVNFLVDNDFITRPNFKIKKLKEEIPQIEIIDSRDLDTLIDYLNQSNNIQLKLVFYLLLTTGVRRTELANIEIKNIDLKNNAIFLSHTKNGIPRDIFLIDEIKDLVIANMHKYENQTFLFTRTNSNEKISTSTIDYYFKKIKKDLNIKVLSPHKLRHTYATYLVRNGADLNSVRLLLGHTTLSMTQKYLDFQNSLLKKVNKTFNPLKNFKKNSA